MDVRNKAVALTEPLRNLDGRNVPGIDAASDLKRLLEALDFPVPLPDPNRRFA